MRREGEQTIQCFECFFKTLFLFTYMGFLSFSHDRKLDVGAPARTIRCANSTESWMFILNRVGILYSFRVPSAPFDILVSHRLFSPAPRCEHGIRNSYTMACPPVRGDNPRALASGLSYVQVDKHGITILCHQH